MKNSRPLDLDKANFISNLISFICAALIIIFTFCGVAYGLLEKPNEITPERGVFIFHLFTVNSNLLSLVASILTVSFTIQGIVKKRYEVPNWAFQVLYCATICVTLTFVFALALILPRNGVSAVIGMNFFFHIICPILCIIEFYLVSCEKKIKLLNSLLVMIPFILYGLVYTVMVLILGEENGGWRDIYRLFTFVPWYVTFLIMIPAVYGLSLMFGFTHNKVVYKRQMDIEAHIIARYQGAGREEILQRIRSLGQKAIKDLSGKTLSIPLRDLYLIAKSNQSVTIDELTASFTQGYIEDIEELRQAKADKKKK